MSKIILCYRKNKDKKILNNAYISLNKKILDYLECEKNNNILNFIYKNKEIQLYPCGKKIETENKALTKMLCVVFSGSSKKIAVPLEILKDFGIEIDDREITIEKKDGYISIKKKIGEKKEIKIGKVVTVNRDEKREIITSNIAVRLAQEGNKILLISTDLKNSVYASLTKPNMFSEKILMVKKGLKSWVSSDKGEIIFLRENLDFIALEGSLFSANFYKRLPLFLRKKILEYDYIIVDSINITELENIFFMNSDKIIIEREKESEINKIQDIDTEKLIIIDKEFFIAIGIEKKIKKLNEDGISIFEIPDENLEVLRKKFDAILELLV